MGGGGHPSPDPSIIERSSEIARWRDEKLAKNIVRESINCKLAATIKNAVRRANAISNPPRSRHSEKFRLSFTPATMVIW